MHCSSVVKKVLDTQKSVAGKDLAKTIDQQCQGLSNYHNGIWFRDGGDHLYFYLHPFGAWLSCK